MKNDMDIFRKLRVGRKILYANLFKKYLPLTVSWAITRRCNQNCIYCGISSVQKNELDTPEVIRIIDKLASLGTERISFTGGEPLLRDDLGYIIDYAKSKGIFSAINTNGKLIAGTIDKISNASRITLSLDGPEEVYSKLRQDNSYGKVTDAIKICTSRKIPVVLTTVLSKYNLDCADFILDIAKKFNVKAMFQPVLPYMLGANRENPAMPDTEEYRKAIKALIREKRSGNKYIYNSLAGLEHLYGWPEPTPVSCWAAKLHCRIDCDGNIYPCGHTAAPVNESPINYTELDRYSIESINNCNQCWCAAMVEFNLIASFNIKAIFNIIYMGV